MEAREIVRASNEYRRKAAAKINSYLNENVRVKDLCKDLGIFPAGLQYYREGQAKDIMEYERIIRACEKLSKSGNSC